MRVLLFGALGEVAGWRERYIVPPPLSLFALRDQLAEIDAALGAALIGRGVLMVVDQTLVRGDVALSSSMEVAFMSPMSGG